jgi:hypothetical protein
MARMLWISLRYLVRFGAGCVRVVCCRGRGDEEGDDDYIQQSGEHHDVIHMVAAIRASLSSAIRHHPI